MEEKKASKRSPLPRFSRSRRKGGKKEKKKTRGKLRRMNSTKISQWLDSTFSRPRFQMVSAQSRSRYRAFPFLDLTDNFNLPFVGINFRKIDGCPASSTRFDTFFKNCSTSKLSKTRKDGRDGRFIHGRVTRERERERDILKAESSF